jgi:hypothetical protein
MAASKQMRAEAAAEGLELVSVTRIGDPGLDQARRAARRRKSDAPSAKPASTKVVADGGEAEGSAKVSSSSSSNVSVIPVAFEGPRPPDPAASAAAADAAVDEWSQEGNPKRLRV